MHVQVILKTDDGTCFCAEGSQVGTTTPAARFAHAACAMTTDYQLHMCVFGGMGEDTDYQDLLSWAPTIGATNAD